MNPKYADPVGEDDEFGADYNHLLYFNRFRASFPGALYVELDDVILLRAWSTSAAQTATITLRIMTPGGDILNSVYTVAGAVNSLTPTLTKVNNLEGFILSASATSDNTAEAGLFLSVMLQRGGGTGDVTFGHVLMQGYTSTIDALGFPQSPVRNSTDGRGLILPISVANPVAGADFSLTVPAGMVVAVRALRAVYTASATVGNRFPTLQWLGTGALIGWQVPPIAAVTAGQVVTFSWGPGLQLANVNGFETIGIPMEVRCSASRGTIRSITPGIDGADQWSAIVVECEAWVGN